MMTLSLTEPSVANTQEEPMPLVFAAVYAQHFRGIWRTLRRLGVPDAQLDDAAQDVFVVVHRRLAAFDGRSLLAWLYAIAVRVASDYRRQSTRRTLAPLSESIADVAAGPGQVSELNESVRLLHALLAKLDPDKRTVFVLAELEQLSVPDIAEALGLNLNTVYSQKRAARAEFDAALKRYQKREAHR